MKCQLIQIILPLLGGLTSTSVVCIVVALFCVVVTGVLVVGVVVTGVLVVGGMLKVLTK
jgi:hypothetical protein